MKTKVHRLEVMVIDLEGLGAQGVKDALENTSYPNHCIYPEVIAIDTREIEWSDNHPLNNSYTYLEAYRELFKAI